MGTTSGGLTTLSKRINRLESKLEQSESDDDLLTEVVNDIKREEKKTKKSKNAEVIDHFKKDFLNTYSVVLDDAIVEIVTFVVRYVEANSAHIAQFLNVMVTSAFKQRLAVAFIRSLTTSHNTTFLTNSIDTLCRLLFSKIIPVTKEKRKGVTGLFNKS